MYNMTSRSKSDARRRVFNKLLLVDMSTWLMENVHMKMTSGQPLKNKSWDEVCFMDLSEHLLMTLSLGVEAAE